MLIKPYEVVWLCVLGGFGGGGVVEVKKKIFKESIKE